MPISRSEFESGELDPGILIMDFLRSNPDYAYTVYELLEQLASNGVNLTDVEIEEILKSLESRGRIKAKAKSGVVYYIYNKTIGLAIRDNP